MSSLSASARSAALCSCQTLLFATVGVSWLSYREKQTHRFPNRRCTLYNKHNPPQPSRPSNDQSIREFLKADSHWFGTNVIIHVNVLLVCWVRRRSCDSKDFLSDREYIQNPPSAHPCTCRHSVGYCLMRMRISLYQGKHWCSSAIVLIVSPRSIIPFRLSFIHLCDWASVRACMRLCWVSVHRCSCTWPIVPMFACRHANMRPRHFRPDAPNRL